MAAFIMWSTAFGNLAQPCFPDVYTSCWKCMYSGVWFLSWEKNVVEPVFTNIIVWGAALSFEDRLTYYRWLLDAGWSNRWISRLGLGKEKSLNKNYILPMKAFTKVSQNNYFVGILCSCTPNSEVMKVCFSKCKVKMGIISFREGLLFFLSMTCSLPSPDHLQDLVNLSTI